MRAVGMCVLLFKLLHVVKGNVGWIAHQKKLAFILQFGYMGRERKSYGLADPAIEPLVVAKLT
jgi:hypothetical protein